MIPGAIRRRQRRAALARRWVIRGLASVAISGLFLALAGYDIARPWRVPCEIEARLCEARHETVCPPIEAWFCPPEEDVELLHLDHEE